MKTTGGLVFNGITFIASPAPDVFQNFGNAYITNASGNWLSLNQDGSVLAIGASILSRSGTSWSVQETLSSSATNFGKNTSISGDGLTVAISGSSSGTIYSRVNKTASFSNVFTTTSSIYGFGSGIELSDDGTAFVYPVTANTLRLGKVSSGTWSELANLDITISGQVGNGDPAMVVMNTDGTRIAFSRWSATVSGATGAGYVGVCTWDKTSTSPTLIQTIYNSGGSGSFQYFGNNLDISPDGNTLIVWDRNGSGVNQAGRTHIYRWNGSQYAFEQAISGTTGLDLGSGSGLGNDIMALTTQANAFLNASVDEFKIYARSNNTWTIQQTKSLPAGFVSLREGDSNAFRNTVVLSGDGKHLIVHERTGTPRFAYYQQGG